jgi:hypothetical protein
VILNVVIVNFQCYNADENFFNGYTVLAAPFFSFYSGLLQSRRRGAHKLAVGTRNSGQTGRSCSRRRILPLPFAGEERRRDQSPSLAFLPASCRPLIHRSPSRGRRESTANTRHLPSISSPCFPTSHRRRTLQSFYRSEAHQRFGGILPFLVILVAPVLPLEWRSIRTWIDFVFCW